jgi:4,5-DOPA dioxygenase extradiol
MPALFLGHGNPMNALDRNPYTEGWRAVAAALPRPRAILSVSAHWYVPGIRVTAGDHPKTIHDFGGFPRPLFEVQYPAPGLPDLGRRVQDLLAPAAVVADHRWGLDHGTWSVLCHMYPQADVPVVQLGLDETLAAEQHYALGRRLRGLREEGILVLGSGNVVHNLHTYAWGRHAVDPYPWAVRFDGELRRRISAGDDGYVVAYEGQGSDASLSAPTPDHFLPLVYVLAQREADDDVSFPVQGFDGGSISMLAVQLG